jgi:hypothetical protein
MRNLLGELLAGDRVPECYIPPGHVLEYRALLELYHDLRAGHTGWAQRIQAVLFHQGATRLGEAGMVGPLAQARLERLAQMQLSPVGQVQVATALTVVHTLGAAARSAAAASIHGAAVARGPDAGRGDLRGRADDLAGVVQLDHPSVSNHRPRDTSRVIWSIR